MEVYSSLSFVIFTDRNSARRIAAPCAPARYQDCDPRVISWLKVGVFRATQAAWRMERERLAASEATSHRFGSLVSVHDSAPAGKRGALDILLLDA